MAGSMRFYTVATPGHYSHYLPLYVYCIKQFLPDWSIETVVTGEIDEATRKAFSVIGGKDVLPRVLDRDMKLEGEANLMRFLYFPQSPWAQYTMVTDADLLLFEDPLQWHVERLVDDTYAGHLGPKKRPWRPEIHGPDGWTGKFQRVAGGFFLATQYWFSKTCGARAEIRGLLDIGALHKTGWREMDEVMLARMIKSSGFKLPSTKGFPANLRGIHIGDFKRTMTHRWTSMEKMVQKLTNENCVRFREVEKTEEWKRMLKYLCGDEELVHEISNIRAHVALRGY